MRFHCPDCGYVAPKDHIWPSCGLGTTWDLVKCPKCEQLFAAPFTGGFVPKEVLQDPQVKVVTAEALRHAEAPANEPATPPSVVAMLWQTIDRIYELVGEPDGENKGDAIIRWIERTMDSWSKDQQSAIALGGVLERISDENGQCAACGETWPQGMSGTVAEMNHIDYCELAQWLNRSESNG